MRQRTCSNCVLWNPNFDKTYPGEPEKTCLRTWKKTEDEDTCDGFFGPWFTERNVPQHTEGGFDMDPNNQQVMGVHILIETHAKDIPWLVESLRSIRKFATGFSGVTVSYPIQSSNEFRNALKQFDVLQAPYHEASNGFLHHMVRMATAERIVPLGTSFVLHMDADCIFTMPTTPEHYFTAGRPHYLWRTYASLIEVNPINPKSKVISDCHQWMEPTRSQIGIETEAYTMCRHPTVFPVEFYPIYRNHVGTVHSMPFYTYMLSGRNAFPQSRMDFTAMGAFAFERLPQMHHWIDIMRSPFPKDRMKAFWSHGGITPEVREEIDRILQ